jgi:transcription antitermination factor NusG
VRTLTNGVAQISSYKPNPVHKGPSSYREFHSRDSLGNSWYVIRSKPNKEEFLAGQLTAHGINVYHPRIHVQTVNPRARKVRSYFPGYLFVQLDLASVNASTLHWMPGASGLVSYGGEPASVPDTLLAAINRRVDEINAAGGELFDVLRSGDAVLIHAGPFEGYEAIFESRIPGSERVRVLLKLLQKRMQPLDLPAAQVQFKKTPSR